MTTINGKLNASINGVITVTPSHPFIDTSTNPKTVVLLPYEAPITNGAFTITVPQSQNLSGTPGVTTEGITYNFQPKQTKTTTTYYFLDGSVYKGAVHLHTDSKYYTGSVHSAQSQLLDKVDDTSYLIIPDSGIYAVVPDSPTPIDYANLIAIPQEQPYLNITLYRLAELLTTVTTYKDRISSKFTIKGQYDPNTFYVFGDLVRFNGNGYLWRNAASLKGQQPPMTGDDANWFMIVQKGDPGGTGAQIVGYSPTTWAGSNQAAAREDVRAAIASLGNIDLSPYALKADTPTRQNPVFTGQSAKRSVMTYPVADTEKPSEIVTADYVEDAISALIPAGVLPRPLIYARRVAQQDITTSGYTVIAWDNRVINTGTVLATNGDITIPADGNYLLHVNLLFEVAGNIGANNTRTIFDVVVSKYANSTFTDFGNLIYENESSTAGAWRSRRIGWRFLAGVFAGDTFNVRAKMGGGGVDSSGNSISPGGNTGQNNYFVMWRIA